MDNEDLHPWESVKQLRYNRDYWQQRATVLGKEADYYRRQLSEAHALLGRVVHQTSERWDSVNITEHFPTNNLHGRRNSSNPEGEKND